MSAATDAAVIASISTPVRSNALTDAFTRIDPVSGSGSNSTDTAWRARGWDRGIRSDVFFAAAIPARRATARTSPLAAFPSRIVATVSGFMFTVAPAVATRNVGSLPLTSTITARPLASKWVRLIGHLSVRPCGSIGPCLLCMLLRERSFPLYFQGTAGEKGKHRLVPKPRGTISPVLT